MGERHAKSRHELENFIIVGVVVIDVTVIVVITTTVNNLSGLAMSGLTLKLYPEPPVTCVSKMRVSGQFASEWTVRMRVPFAQRMIFEFLLARI